MRRDPRMTLLAGLIATAAERGERPASNTPSRRGRVRVVRVVREAAPPKDSVA